MSDGIGSITPARGAGSEAVRAAERAPAPIRNEPPADAAAPDKAARPATDDSRAAAGPVDAIALGEARERIAAVLDGASADIAERLDGLVRAAPIPLAPGADGDAVAAAQALAQLIAANSRPAILAQARLGPSAVRMVIGG